MGTNVKALGAELFSFKKITLKGRKNLDFRDLGLSDLEIYTFVIIIH